MRIFIIKKRKSHDLIIWTLSYKTWALIKTACRRNNRYYDSCIWMGNIISCIKSSCNSSGGGASRQKVVKGVVKQRTGIICLFLDFECEWIGTRLKIQFDNGNYVIVRQGCMPTNYWYLIAPKLNQYTFDILMQFKPDGWLITPILTCEMPLHIHSQTSTVAPLKFRNW